MSTQNDIGAAQAFIRSRLDTLASISASTILIPGSPQERYHTIIEETYVVLGLMETQRWCKNRSNYERGMERRVSKEFADGFTGSGSTPYQDSPKPRFYADHRGSWCVRDRETLIKLGDEMHGQP